MAETPFSPESGAASGGTAPEDGTQGTPPQPPADVTPQPASAAPGPAAVEPSPAVAAPGDVPVEPGAEPEAAVPPAPSAGLPAMATPPSPPEPVAAGTSQPDTQPPGVAATIAVPPLEEAESGAGGEWDLLVERISAWWTSGELNRQWQRIRGPLKGVAILVAVVLALQVYGTVVRTVDGIPLVSGLLELTGLIAALQFSFSRLLRSSDRQEVLSQLQRRWLDFRGRS